MSPSSVRGLIAGGLLGALLLLVARSALAAEAVFAVEFEAPDAVRKLLVEHVEISRWRGHERMTPEEFRRLYRTAPQEIGDLLSTQGYYSPSIEAELDEQPGRLTARFRVDPGAPVTVTSLQIDVTGALTQEDADASRKTDRLRASWPLPVGSVFQHSDWEAGKRELLRALALDRYPLASIAKSEAAVDPVRRTVALSVVVDSGPAVRFGGLRIEGLTRYPPSIVENLNPIGAGQPYSQLRLQEFQTRLLESGYFNSVTVDAPADPNGIADVRVWVEERESRRIAFGLGYSTDTGTRVQAQFRQINFLNRGLQFGTRFKVESKGHLARVDLFFPANVDGYRDRLIAETERKDVQGTVTDKVVLTAGRTRIRGDIETDVSVNYIVEEEEVEDFGRDTRSAVTGNWAYTIRRTNHPLFPDGGYLLNLQLGGSPGILVAETSFFRVYGRAVYYLKAGEHGVITLRAEVGSVFTNETREVPTDYLFRTGGDQTVRGYAYQSLGVRKGSAVTGGRALAVASAEYTHWVNDTWGIAVFYDAGNAADDFHGFRLAHGYGLGARWRSPVGPLNLDLAYGRDSGDVRLHFSVGLAF